MTCKRGTNIRRLIDFAFVVAVLAEVPANVGLMMLSWRTYAVRLLAILSSGPEWNPLGISKHQGCFAIFLDLACYAARFADRRFVLVSDCQLDPSVFATFGGPCVSATWTEVPGQSPTGFTALTNGTKEIIAGTTRQRISGTLQKAVALAQESVVGSELASTTIEVFIGLTHNVTVKTQLP